MHLREEVAVEDGQEALRLYKSAMQEAAMDPVTGWIDMDAIMTGVSANQRMMREELGKSILEVLRAAPGGFAALRDVRERIEAATNQVLTPEILRSALSLLRGSGQVEQEGDNVRLMGAGGDE